MNISKIETHVIAIYWRCLLLLFFTGHQLHLCFLFSLQFILCPLIIFFFFCFMIYFWVQFFCGFKRTNNFHFFFVFRKKLCVGVDFVVVDKITIIRTKRIKRRLFVYVESFKWHLIFLFWLCDFDEKWIAFYAEPIVKSIIKNYYYRLQY